jgi:hypothetical protein
VNLRRPLEGVPGLLLLAVLVLFGATIGVSLALVFSLVEMKDSLANFLGGVVGAGLGAALAVLGAVYVQQQSRRHELTPVRNKLLAGLQFLRDQMGLMHSILGTPRRANAGADALPRVIKLTTQAAERLEVSAELPENLYQEMAGLADDIVVGLFAVSSFVEEDRETPEWERARELALESVVTLASRLDNLQARTRAL